MMKKKHKEIIKRLHKIKRCSSLDLVEFAARTYPEYRAVDRETLERMIVLLFY